MPKKLQIGVIGYAGIEEYPRNTVIKESIFKLAEQIGYLLAKNDAIVVTGGKGGVMDSASRGAKLLNGTTVGVIGGDNRFSSNEHIDIEIFTGMQTKGLDELWLVNMCDSLIVIGGGAGTLEEMCIAYRNNKPIIALLNSGGWADKLAGFAIDERYTSFIDTAATPEEAVEKVINLGFYGNTQRM